MCVDRGSVSGVCVCVFTLPGCVPVKAAGTAAFSVCRPCWKHLNLRDGSVVREDASGSALFNR